MNVPYTYLIGWPELDRWYYGVRYAQNCDPSDFWISYFTSSDVVKKFRAEHGDPPIREIRKKFTGINRITKSREWETRVLKKLKVLLKETWLNNNDSPAPPIIKRYGNDNIMRRPEQRQRMRINNPTNRQDVREKISQSNAGKPPTFTGTHTDKTKNLMKQRWVERKNSGWIAAKRTEEQNKAVSQKLKGRSMSPESISKMKNTIKSKGDRKGANNPAAKPLIFRGIRYSYIRDAANKTGLSIYKILKECEFLK